MIERYILKKFFVFLIILIFVTSCGAKKITIDEKDNLAVYTELEMQRFKLTEEYSKTLKNDKYNKKKLNELNKKINNINKKLNILHETPEVKDYINNKTGENQPESSSITYKKATGYTFKTGTRQEKIVDPEKEATKIESEFNSTNNTFDQKFLNESVVSDQEFYDDFEDVFSENTSQNITGEPPPEESNKLFEEDIAF
jgi:hypothetical protein